MTADRAWRTLGRIYLWLAATRLGRLLRRRGVRYVAAWAAAVIGTAICLSGGWIAQNDAKRRDGNTGHVSLDFSGQWLMGRMMVRGHGQALYDRDQQRAVLEEAYPRDDEEPNQKDSDAEAIMGITMSADVSGGPDGSVRHVGGPLYPPIHALLYAPLGLLSPHAGYRAMQLACMVFLFVAAGGISLLARGRIWWPVAAVLLMFWPGIAGSVTLGQNATESLAILTWGWLLVARGRPGWGGIVWGLLAYKPVWAVAFFLVPVVTRRWRMALGMLGCGCVLAALTLPLVGLHGWRDWLRVGHEATKVYDVDENWIELSRDLLSVPRRWLLDFSVPSEDRDRNWLPPALLGWGALLFVFEATVRLACLRGERPAPVEGPGAAFVLLGAWLTCFHFMYYDVLLAALPAALLFTEPARYFEPLRQRMFGDPAASKTSLLGAAVPIILAAMTTTQPVWFLRLLHNPPGDTFFLLLLWLWCGWRWLSLRSAKR